VISVDPKDVLEGVLTTWAKMQISSSCQRRYKFACPSIHKLTFLMPSGLCCKATSFSGLTTGILIIVLHIIWEKQKGMMAKQISGGISKMKLLYSGTIKSKKTPATKT